MNSNGEFVDLFLEKSNAYMVVGVGLILAGYPDHVT